MECSVYLYLDTGVRLYLVLGHKDEQGSPQGENSGSRQGVGSNKYKKKKIPKYKNKIYKRDWRRICTLQFSIVITDHSHQFRKG